MKIPIGYWRQGFAIKNLGMDVHSNFETLGSNRCFHDVDTNEKTHSVHRERYLGMPSEMLSQKLNYHD